MVAPTPVPAVRIVSVHILVNVARHEMFVVIRTVPLAHPASPAQPSNREPGSGVAVRVTSVPSAYLVFTPLTPFPITVPVPDPSRRRVNVHTGTTVKPKNTVSRCPSGFVT